MVNRRRMLRVMGFLLGAAIVLASLAFAALRRHGLPADRTRSPIDVRRIAIDGTQFAPRDITIPLGATIVWTNADPFPHNVTAEAAQARSGDLAPGESWSFRPEQRGTFTYQCTLHPGMTGVLQVR